MQDKSEISRRVAVTVQLGGGLGNQLFQYAFGRRMALANEAELYIDASGYGPISQPDPELGLRALGLEHFNIHGTLIRRQSVPDLQKPWVLRKILKYWNKAVGIWEDRRPYYLRRRVIEPDENHFRFDPCLYSRPIRRSVSFHGFWQSEKYFYDIREKLRKELVVLDEMDRENAGMARLIMSTDSVCIHVRHGDNANEVAAALGVLPLQYYEKAVEDLTRKVAHPHFLIFSDDIDWAQSELKFRQPVTFVTHNRDLRNYEDLRLMSLCKHHIIANSTFGWWGAWLGKKEGQLVYAPKRYYQNIDRPNPDLYPEHWRLL